MNNNKNGSFKPKKVYFSQVSNSALRDNNLSLKAKGLYALIQSYITIEDFILYKNTLKKNCSEGNTSFESTWKELKDKGYLIQEKHQNSDGTFYYLYELLDVSNHTPKTEGVDNLPNGKRGTYNKIDFINNDSNNNINNILHCLDELSNERFISVYLETMKRYGLKHKRVNEKNLNYIADSIKLIKYDIDIDEWEEKVIEYFENLPKNNDGDIIAFLKASARTLNIRLDLCV